MPAAASAVTLDEILSLSRAGVTDAIILALIDRDKTVFAIEPDQIVKLQRDGLSEAVVLAMLKSGRDEGDQAARADAAANSAWIMAQMPTEPLLVVTGHGPERPNVAHPDGFYSGPPSYFRVVRRVAPLLRPAFVRQLEVRRAAADVRRAAEHGAVDQAAVLHHRVPRGDAAAPPALIRIRPIATVESFLHVVSAFRRTVTVRLVPALPTTVRLKPDVTNHMAPASDIIVVGAGIVGCAVAYELARRGASVEIVDERPVGMGATQASAGVLAPYIEAREGSPLLDLTVRSLDLFDDVHRARRRRQRHRRFRISAPARSTSR